MVVLIELFGRLFLDYLLIIPGVLVRWAFLRLTGRDQSLEYCLRNRPRISAGISIGVLIVIGVINIISSLPTST